MLHKDLNRRRFMNLVALSAAFPTIAAAKANSHHYTWRGTVMGAQAELTFYGTNKTKALEATRRCREEIDRLENIFSLFREHSEISSLNKEGHLPAASHDLRRLINASRYLHHTTKGKFDITVQPLWRLYADWFAKHPGDDGPPDELVKQKKAIIGFEKMRIEGAKITLAKGQAITFNGIAQGYITDQIKDLLRRAGWEHILVDLGEYYALDKKPGGSAFKILLAGTCLDVSLKNQALGSSAGSGFSFPSRRHQHTHLLDPQTAQSPHLWKSLHVRHASTTMADGFSTALSAMSPAEIIDCLARLPRSPEHLALTVWAVNHSNEVKRFYSRS